jgi:hypothetical protein
MAPVSQTDGTGQTVDSAGLAGGDSRCITKFQEASVTPLGPGTKPLPKHNLQGRKILHKSLQTNPKQAKN